MWRAKFSMQEAENKRQFRVSAHSIGDAHSRVQTGASGADQGGDAGCGQNSRERDTISTEHLVADDLRHVTDRRAGIKGGQEASASAGFVGIADKEVRGEVFQ